LIAAPSLRDPNFARTVVLLCDHGPSGSLGLVINRPSELKIAEALADVPGATERPETLWRGGPVQTSSVFILHDRPALGGHQVVEHLAFGADLDLLKRLLNDADTAGARFRLYAGYAGWGAGQLEFELSQESWIVKSADEPTVFSTAGEDAWAEILRSMGGRYALMAQTPPDPTLN